MKVEALMVEGFMASLKVNEMAFESTMPVALLRGSVELTTGAVASKASLVVKEKV